MAARESKHQAWRGGLIRGGRAAGTMAPALLGHLSNVLVKSDMPHTAIRVYRVTGPARKAGGPRAHA